MHNLQMFEKGRAIMFRKKIETYIHCNTNLEMIFCSNNMLLWGTLYNTFLHQTRFTRHTFPLLVCDWICPSTNKWDTELDSYLRNWFNSMRSPREVQTTEEIYSK